MLKKIKGEFKNTRFVIPYRVYGDQGPFVICVNGAQQTMAAWHSVVDHFGEEYRIVLFDLPGQGRAHILSGPSAVSLDEQVSILNQIISVIAKADEAVNLVGASSGAIIVASFAARYQSRVGKIILGSFGVRPTKQMLDAIEEGRRLLRQGKHEEIAWLIIDRFGKQMSESNKKRMIHQFQTMGEEYFLTFSAQCDHIALSRHISQYVNLSDIKAQTLIINGEDDAMIDNNDLKTISSQIQNCEVRLVKDAGHFLHWERADILDLYKEYLNGSDHNGREHA